MATAQIQIDAGSGWVTGSNDDVALNTLTSFQNQNNSGVTTWEWAILTQPDGTQDNFTDSGTLVSALAVPSITLKKEGTYLIRLIVNKGTATEAQNQAIVAVRELETRDRIPAAGETVEGGGSLYGWSKDALDKILRRVTRLSDAGIFVAEANESMTAGDVVHPEAMVTIATGLPGERLLPSVSKALADDLNKIDGPLGVIVSNVEGNPAVGGGDLCRVMVIGELHAQSLGAGVSIGDPVYVSDTGTLSVTPGTYVRQVGDVASIDLGGGTYDVAISAGANSIPRGNAGGDLSAYYPDPTVAKIKGTSITTAGGSLATGAVLRVTGAATADWGAVDLADTDAVTGTLPVARGGTGASSVGTVGGVVWAASSTNYGTTAIGASGLYFKSTGPGTAPTWSQIDLASGSVTGTLPVTRGGTGATSATQYGLIYASTASTYASLPVGATGTVLCGVSGGAPTWGTVPSAAFAANSVPWSAIDDVRIGIDYNTTATNNNTSFTSIATVSLDISPGNAQFAILPQADGTSFEAWLTTLLNNSSATGEIKYIVTGPAGFTTLTYVHKQRSAVASNAAQVTGSVSFPTFNFLATIAGTYTVEALMRVLSVGDIISISNYQLRLWQG